MSFGRNVDKTCNYRALDHSNQVITTYKILTRKYNVAAVPTLVQACTYVTRSNDLRLQKTRFKY